MIDGRTTLLGLLGWPVSHSQSPAMHNAAAADLGLNVTYLPLAVPPDQLAQAVAGLAALGFRGANVTIPHKQAVIPYLYSIGEAVQAVGAVNTIVLARQVVAGELVTRPEGYNTDWSGFSADLQQQNVAVSGRHCIVLGAGGSARAVVYALAQMGGRIFVLARRQEQARTLVQSLFWAGVSAEMIALPLATLPNLTVDAPLIVNTTPVGMSPRPDASIWPDDLPFPPGSFVYDLVYTPAETRLMQQAQQAGCAASNGLGMLLHQGAQAFEMWLGIRPNLTVMQAALSR